MTIKTSPYIYTNQNDIISNLSSYRFDTYLLLADHDTNLAFNLYLYNSRLAKSLLFPLHILEVTLRNKISLILHNDFGTDWHKSSNFTSILTPKSNTSLNLTLSRVKPKVNDVIAGLSFDFWSNLFRHEYDRSLWQKNMPLLLPYHPSSITRKVFQRKISGINHIRNRIAHHEHILKENISDIYKNILEIISWICPETSLWVKHYGTINIAIRSKPVRENSNPVSFSDRADKSFLLIAPEIPLSAIKKGVNYFIVKNNHSVIVISKSNIQEYIFSLTDQDNNLLIDLNELSFSNIISFSSLVTNAHLVKDTDNFYLSESFLTNKIRYIICQDTNKNITGVIEKAHRRY